MSEETLRPDPAPRPARKLRVVSVVDGIGITGGGERFAREVALRLNRDRFDVTLCLSRPIPPVVAPAAAAAALAELRNTGADVMELSRRSRLDLRAWRPLLRMLRERRIDILHTHKFGSNVWGGLLDTLAPAPVFIAHEHTWSYEGKPLRRILDRELIARRADAFVAVSQADRRRMIEVERIDPGKVVVVPNAIPTRMPSVDRDVRAELGIPADALVIGTVCVLRPQKALDMMLAAVARLRTRFPSCRMVIAGEGGERQRLEALASELDIEETIRFLGQRDDVPDVLAAFDVFVLSSDFEGMPLAVIEAMGAGIPVVATRVGGIPDLIDDGAQGLLVPARDPDALAEAIGDLLSNPERARRLGAAGRERREREFDIDVAVRRVERLYEDLYAGSAEASA